MFINRQTGKSGKRADSCVPLLGAFQAIARQSRGISLIELIMFIVIIGIAVAGVLLVMNKVTGQSADPLIRKQAVAIAESLLEEVELMPFTFCDPDDASAVVASSTADCTAPVGGEVIGIEGGETRYADPQFDNVSDYHGFGMAGAFFDVTNTPIPGLNGYSANIIVAQTGIPAVGAAPAIPASESLQITVTVNGPGNTTVVLDGYRTRYAPRSVP